MEGCGGSNGGLDNTSDPPFLILHSVELQLWRMWRIGGRIWVSFFYGAFFFLLNFLHVVVGKGSIASTSSIVAGQGVVEDTMEDAISYLILHPLD
jgi:hypothetical protein